MRFSPLRQSLMQLTEDGNPHIKIVFFYQLIQILDTTIDGTIIILQGIFEPIFSNIT